MKTAVPRNVSLNILFVIDICKLNAEEKCKLQIVRELLLKRVLMIQLDIILYILIEE